MLFLTMHPRNRVFHFNNCLLRLGNPSRWKTEVQNPNVFRSHVSMIKQDHVTSERGFDPKTQLPWQSGLFCTRIFGNLNFKHQRRHRLGTINLAYPVSQIWFLKTSAFVSTLLQQKRSRLIRLSQSRAFMTTPEKTRHPEPSDFLPGAFSYNVALKQNWVPNEDVMLCWPTGPSELKHVSLALDDGKISARDAVAWDRFLPNALLFEDANHVFAKKANANPCAQSGFYISPCAASSDFKFGKKKTEVKKSNPRFRFSTGQGERFFSKSRNTFHFQREKKQTFKNASALRQTQTGLFWCLPHAKVSPHVLKHLWFKPENSVRVVYRTVEARWRFFLNPAVWPQKMILWRLVWFLVNLQNRLLNQLSSLLLKPNVFYPEIAFAMNNNIPWARVLVLKLPNKTKSKFKPVQKRVHPCAWKRFCPRGNVFLKFALGCRAYALPKTVLEKQNVTRVKFPKRFGSKTQINKVLSLFHNACTHEQKKKTALTKLRKQKVFEARSKTKIKRVFGKPEHRKLKPILETWGLKAQGKPVWTHETKQAWKQHDLFGGKTCKSWFANTFRVHHFLAFLASTVVSRKDVLFASAHDQNRLEFLVGAFKLQARHFLGLNTRAVWFCAQANPKRFVLAARLGSKATWLKRGLKVWAAEVCFDQLWYGCLAKTQASESTGTLRQTVIRVKRMDLGPCACAKQAELRSQQTQLYGRFLVQKGPALFRHRCGCVRNGWVHLTLRRYLRFMTYACPFDWGFDRTGLVADANYAMVHYVDRGLTQVQNPTGAAALRWTLSRWEQTKSTRPEADSEKSKSNPFAVPKGPYDGFDFVLSKKQASLKADLRSLNAKHWHGKIFGSMPKHKRRKKCARLNRFFKILKRTRFRTCAQFMTLRFLPVLPPDLRPALMLPNSVLANSDLNLLYQNVLKNNQSCLKSSFYAYLNPFWHTFPRFLGQLSPTNLSFDWRVRQPWVWIHYRRLQASVDALLELGLPGPKTNVSLSIKPGLKSLGMGLKGKRGRFRQNLLGKRVDYSARSVIVVGPNLSLQECGLPEDIAFELFQCHLSRKLLNHGFANNLNQAKSQIQMRTPWVYDLLQNVLRDVPVLLNRAPTLHRLGFQAFRGRLIRGRALLLHPLVCGGFNADFDGDQMAVHVPLSPLAQAEASRLMQSSLNMLSPRDGSPNLVPSQDMVLGLTYLTSFDLRYDAERWKAKSFSNTTKQGHGQKKCAPIKSAQNAFLKTHFEPYELPFQIRCVYQKNHFQTQGKQTSFEVQIQPHGGLVWVYPNFKKCVSQAGLWNGEKTMFWVFTSVGRVLMHLHLQKQSLKL